MTHEYFILSPGPMNTQTSEFNFFCLLVSIFLDRVLPCFVYYFRFYDTHRDRFCSSWKFRVVAGPACDLLLLLFPQKKGKALATTK